MYEVEFTDVSEIRMGSPFNLAKPIIRGDFVPDLSQYEFQDVAAKSEDGNELFLAFWDLQGNYPAFRVLLLNEKERTVTISSRIVAACRELRVDAGTGKLRAIIWDVFEGEREIDVTFTRSD